jgi:hypothetical protein
MNALSKIYIKLIKTHQNIDYTFGLDSFHFQNRLIEIEYENIKQIFNSINNRMYCEYYKLYKILQDYINTEIKDDSILEHIQHKKTFPKYNDIEPLKKYEFSLILEIQQLIVKILQLLHEHYTSKQKALETNSSHSAIGINIENLINYQHYSNTLLSEKINMFCRYLNVFYKHHNKYISRLLLKTKMMLGIVNEDINLKQGYSLTTPNTNILNTMQINNDVFSTTTENSLNNNEINNNEINNNEMNNNEMINGRISSPSIGSINEIDESNIKKYINYDNSHKNLQGELINIFENNPQQKRPSPPDIITPNNIYITKSLNI